MTAVKTIKTDSEIEVSELLDCARRSPKNDYHIYADFKRQLERLHISSGQYEQTHRRLINILCL